MSKNVPVLPIGTSLVVAELRNMRTVIDSWEKFLDEHGFPYVDNQALAQDQLMNTLQQFCGEMLFISDKAHSIATRITTRLEEL